ncbi:putative isoflavone-7-O-beta-glucoside 6''-O-malonyltransferase [Medicago truncatula]|uniref:Putative isoflavone-7-O-beta-glucoside 6''-O-malonyltransferase n=1 Tax=Medicago truncatula TaxID=3880 RepID=A0A396HC99_MEDTR|nr:phenolic glucoside malonyltransferase 1 [Medicago truncatula]RHN50243.1 putative isoflavone-7-O-beta-glucoside 6''-O-malonyltransferase [Medicago truncatula]
MEKHEESFKVVQVCNVEPYLDTTKPFSSPTSLPLTFFDLLWLRFPPVELLFFYELTNSTTFFYDTLLPNLKHSLSLTLQHFLPLAGNITWPSDSSKPIINYVKGDNSISFNVVESKESFKDLSSHHCEASKRHHLIPHLKISHEKASLLAIQVTLFPNNGFCIGITTHHAALDGKSLSTFMKSWSYVACSNSKHDSSFLSLPETLTPFFDRSLIQDHNNGIGISDAYVVDLMKQGGPNNRSLKIMNFSGPVKHDVVKSLFELTPSNIQKLKEHGKNDMKMKVINLSTFLVTSAYILACLAKAEQPKVEKVVFIISMDCRSRLDPSISTMYIGNCIAGQKIVFETKNLVGKNGFLNALEGINKALNSVKDVGVLNGAENWVSNMYSGFEGAFSLGESRNNNGGIEIGLALNKEELEAFSTIFVEGLESI